MYDGNGILLGESTPLDADVQSRTFSPQGLAADGQLTVAAMRRGVTYLRIIPEFRLDTGATTGVPVGFSAAAR